ncbi:cell division protein FtsL [Ferriphaselus sp. R-1]|uniref:cell division protein FtsL n=1 Tax=Ferriphaselus sp. R-1 TaxID=1485544 RepID=UPI00055411F6|nr:cell division protein FtsL [Ferriphaselus sp. R-1]
MNRLDLLLLIVAIVCALGTITAQHHARKLTVAIQHEKDSAQQMEVEWGQLRLEHSTWSMPARVENIVTNQLQMQLPNPKQIQYVHVSRAMLQEAQP